MKKPLVPYVSDRRTKHTGITEELRKWVRSDDCPERLPKLVEMAETWGVAPLTMKKAVDTLKEQGVLRVVRGQGIFPTRLKRPRTHVLGSVLYGNGIAPLHAQLIHGMSRAAHARGETMAMGQGSMGNDEAEEREVRLLCEKQGVDGIVLWPTLVPRGARSAAVEYLLQEEIPFVLVPEPDRELYRDCSSVTNLDSGAAADVMTHLIARGYRNIGFVYSEGEEKGPHLRHRRAQVEQSLRAAGFPRKSPLVVASYVAEIPDPLPEEIEAYLRSCDAVFCSNDHVATGILHLCLRLGIRVPTDLAVTGYDNVHLSRVLGLTTVEQHFAQIGEQAVNLLLDEIEGRATGPAHREVASELVVRASS